MIKKKLINIASIIIGAAGILGMLFCFLFLWSTNMKDLVGAGFPFLGGAILTGMGLLSLAINKRNQS
jgi:hypothetical protein